MKLVTGITDSFSYIYILLCYYSLGFNIFFSHASQHSCCIIYFEIIVKKTRKHALVSCCNMRNVGFFSLIWMEIW